MRSVHAAILLAGLAGAVLSGCKPPDARNRPPEPIGPVSEVALLSRPTAQNFDDEPGPDGLLVRVYFFRMDRPQAVRVSGDLDFLLYAGRVGKAQLPDAEPFRTESYPFARLDKLITADAYGWGYTVPLLWYDLPADTKAITVVVRYRNGQTFRFSDPTTVFLND